MPLAPSFTDVDEFQGTDIDEYTTNDGWDLCFVEGNSHYEGKEHGHWVVDNNEELWSTMIWRRVTRNPHADRASRQVVIYPLTMWIQVAKGKNKDSTYPPQLVVYAGRKRERYMAHRISAFLWANPNFLTWPQFNRLRADGHYTYPWLARPTIE